MKWRTTAITAALILVAAAVYYLIPSNSLRSRARRQWKDAAIERLQHTLNDRAVLQRRVASLLERLRQSRHAGDRWIDDDLLLMQNGEWMLCENICQKQDYRIQDLFIGSGSDGRWYYSTFHFCIGKEVLRMEAQPESLTQLVKGYWLVPFDGKSDDCLRATWDGSASWGVDKAPSTITAP